VQVQVQYAVLVLITQQDDLAQVFSKIKPVTYKTQVHCVIAATFGVIQAQDAVTVWQLLIQLVVVSTHVAVLVVQHGYRDRDYATYVLKAVWAVLVAVSHSGVTIRHSLANVATTVQFIWDLITNKVVFVSSVQIAELQDVQVTYGLCVVADHHAIGSNMYHSQAA
jgi:hypothetical protein